MSGDDLSALAPLAGDRLLALRARARDVVRDWVAARDTSIAVAQIAGLGSEAIAAAADATRRLPSGRSEAADTIARVLEDLRALAQPPAPPPPRARWGFTAAPPAPAAISTPDEARLGALLAELERARDALLREGVTLDAAAARLRDADALLEDRAHLLRAMAAQADAAARELAIDDPARSAALRGDVVRAIETRAADMLTQLVVTRQGLLSLDILREGQARLGEATDRARTALAAALRTAMAAARAVEEGRRMHDQASALDRSAAAAAADTDRGEAVRRVLADAVAQVDAAVSAARTR